MMAIGKFQSTNVVFHHATVTRARRERMNGHKAAVLWFTGLSGAGKSTLAHAVEETLHQLGCRTYVLDGDNVRHGLCGDLGFSVADRHENIRRIGEVAKLFTDAGNIVLTAFISPHRADRDWVRSLHGEGFIEIHCRCPIEVCESRDVKGLYKKARAGEIKDFTGISSPYEEPDKPEVVIETSDMSLDDSVDAVLACLRNRKIIDPVHNVIESNVICTPSPFGRGLG
ncbi:adenylyl-sulfate kinase [Methylococcus geothermalis]|uniref:Adenylyl-sulfate kinase n=1 Tax=Methylococcus geothermalis TaxID=2681310 RepID=A0A858QAC8_9GAMM|nr:adenylyl-sulfate kinase [Methylococcus geothermalis]QJD30664.1 adenylyl-sulfate kinase [Methylococcus geothermalis]